MYNQRLVNILLRLSIASVFLYAAIASFLDPLGWIDYLPQFLRNIFHPQELLTGFSIFQIVLAAWILSGWKTFLSASIAAITLLGIIGTNFRQLDTLFRDFAILFAALALAAGAYEKKQRK